jgi:hypothetical protein
LGGGRSAARVDCLQTRQLTVETRA